MKKLQEKLVNLKISININFINVDAIALISYIKEQKYKEANIT